MLNKTIINQALRPYIYMILVVAICATFVFMWAMNGINNAPTANEQIAVKAQVSDEVKDVPKVDVVVTKPIKVYKGGAALKNGLKLPQNVIESESEKVLSSIETPKSDHAYTVTTVLNDQTGEHETYIKQEPLPWVAYDYRGSIGAYYGLKNGEQAIRVQARQDLLNVKSVRIGVVATLDSTQSGNNDTFIGVGASYHW